MSRAGVISSQPGERCLHHHLQLQGAQIQLDFTCLQEILDVNDYVAFDNFQSMAHFSAAVVSPSDMGRSNELVWYRVTYSLLFPARESLI